MKNVAVILFFVPFLAISQEYGTLNVTKINSVYDGDTFRADISNIHPLIGENIAIRVAGVDTPEIRGKCDTEKALAIEARDFVKSKLNNSTNIILKNVQRGKYFRIVADVYIDGISLTSLLLTKELAYPYQGGKKESWCHQ